MGDRGTPRLTADQVISIFQRDGITLAGSTGSHQKWRNVSTAKQVIVPYHRGRSLPLGTMRAIIEGSGIDPRIGSSNRAIGIPIDGGLR